MERVCAQRDRYAVDDIDQLRRLFNIAAEALIHHTQICCPCAAELQVLDTNPLAVIGGMSFLDDLLDWLRGLIDTCHGLLQRAAGDGNMRRVFTLSLIHILTPTSSASWPTPRRRTRRCSRSITISKNFQTLISCARSICSISTATATCTTTRRRWPTAFCPRPRPLPGLSLIHILPSS